jgi:outer membrane lipoprotein-sorting protein
LSAKPTEWGVETFSFLNKVFCFHAFIFRTFLGLLLAACLTLFVAEPAKAEVRALSVADRADIVRIESYLNSLTTLKARFLQVSSDGNYIEGDLYISRPGKMRIAYDAPSPILIVSDGENLIYHDSELKQVSYVGIDSTPASLLVEEHISLFGGRFKINAFERGAGALRVALEKADDPAEGRLTLVFSNNPLVLKKWSVVDPQGVMITVSLSKSRFGIPLKQELFQFEDPYQDSIWEEN